MSKVPIFLGTEEALAWLKTISERTTNGSDRVLLMIVHGNLVASIERIKKQRAEDRANNQQRINDTVNNSLLHWHLDELVKLGETFTSRHVLGDYLKSVADEALDGNSDIALDVARDFVRRADFYAIADKYPELLPADEPDDEDDEDDEEGSDDE